MAFVKYVGVSTIAFAAAFLLLVIQAELREREEANQPLTCHAHRCT
jgi:hypothetical protein